MSTSKTPEQRFWEKVNMRGGYPDFSDPLVRLTEADGECWTWTATKMRGGYGSFWLNGGNRRAHKVSLAWAGVTVPEGFAADHLCRRTGCVRPDHFEVVPERVNVLRSGNPLAENARKTHCKHGHEFTPENTRPASGGRPGRRCRECSRIECRESQRVRRMRNKRKDLAI